MSYLFESNYFLLSVASTRLEILYLNFFLPNFHLFRQAESGDSLLV